VVGIDSASCSMAFNFWILLPQCWLAMIIQSVLENCVTMLPIAQRKCHLECKIFRDNLWNMVKFL